jgi:hypothetical protein
MTLSVTQNIARNYWMIVSKEMEGVWKEVIVAYINFLLGPVRKKFYSFS